MRVIITGSRDWSGTWAEESLREVLARLEALCEVLGVDLDLVQGGCPTGADAIVRRWQDARDIEPITYEANWSLGKAAGPIRNTQMINDGADMVIGFLKDDSKGTRDCLIRAKVAGIFTAVVPWAEPRRRTHPKEGYGS